MKLQAFSVRDSKSETFGPLFFKHTPAEATRDFTTLVNDPQSTVSQFPEDYDLYHHGEYDNLSGAIIALNTPQHVIKAVMVRKT